MPTNLVFELALSRAEAGDYGGASKMFNDRFFGREEGGTNVREVWIEVKLSQALGLSRAGKCEEALEIVRTLGSPVAGLAFTENGLEANSGIRTNQLSTGRIAFVLWPTNSSRSTITRGLHGQRSFRKWSGPGLLPESTPVMTREQWHGRLSASLSQAETRIRTSSFKGWWTYTAATLQIALGLEEQAKVSLRQAVLLPESLMSYHFARLALAGATPRN